MEQVILRFTIFQMNQIKDCIVKIKKAVLKLTALFLYIENKIINHKLLVINALVLHYTIN